MTKASSLDIFRLMLAQTGVFLMETSMNLREILKVPEEGPLYLLLDERIIEDTHSTWSQFLIVKELVGDKEKALALVAALSGP